MADVMKLSMVLSATDKMSRVIDQAVVKSTKKLTEFQKRANLIGGGFQKVGLSILGVGVATGTAMLTMSKTTATHAKEIYRASQKIGMSNEGFQVYSKAAERAGIETEKFQGGVARLMKNQYAAVTGNKKMAQVFASVGVSAKDSQGHLKKSDILLKEISDRFQKAPNGPIKTALAIQLFGKSGMNMIPMLNNGSKSLDTLKNEMRETGEMISDEGVANSMKFNIKLREMSDRMEGAKNKIGLALVPAFTILADEILKVITQVTTWIDKNKALIPQMLHWAKIAMIVGASIWGIGTVIKTVVAIMKIWKGAMAACKIVMMGVNAVSRFGIFQFAGLKIAQLASAAATGVATAAQWLLNAAFIASPIGWIVLGIGALIAVTVICWKKFAGFRAVIKTVWDTVKGFGNILKEYVIDRIKGIISGLGAMGRAIGLLFKGKFAEAGKTALQGVKDLSGVTAAQNAVKKSVVLVQGIPNSFNRHLAIEQAAQKAKEEPKSRAAIRSSNAYNTSNIQRANVNNAPVLNYSPVIHINGGSPTAKQDFSKMLNDHKLEMDQYLKKYFQNQQRLSFI